MHPSCLLLDTGVRAAKLLSSEGKQFEENKVLRESLGRGRESFFVHLYKDTFSTLICVNDKRQLTQLLMKQLYHESPQQRRGKHLQ